MNLGLSEESASLIQMFERVFEAESTPARVRAAEAAGFDDALWRTLAELGVPLMRVSAARGGSELSLLDAMMMMEQAGRRLASVPLAEAIVAGRLLAQSDAPEARTWLERMGAGDAVVSFALKPLQQGERQIVAGGSAASAIVVLEGDRLMLHILAKPLEPLHTIAACGFAWVTPSNTTLLLVEGPKAIAAWEAAVEEWKLLSASALIGLSDQALQMASAYASERTAFGQLIGTFQGISHPLANCAIDVDGARLFAWRIVSAISAGEETAAAAVDQLWWWVNRTATRTVAHALHCFGGYGLTNEYDIQLYHRRAKAIGLVLGDPEAALVRAGRRLYLGATASLPDTGDVSIDFSPSETGQELVHETRKLFETLLTPELKAKAHHSFEGHDWGVNRAFGEARLLFPSWPKEWGGRGASDEAARESLSVWDEFGWTVNPQGVSNMVGRIVMAFGSDEAKREVLPPLARGEIIACLGYTEPSCGSDVFACRTRAERDGDDWLINGQKMFTSGADLASHVLLLTRTEPGASKHSGLTLFLVPLKRPGIEIRPIFTFMDEQTNATFYSDVRVEDRYRLGEVNGGVKVLAAALQMEQGGATYYRNQFRMVAVAADWARNRRRDNRVVIEDPQVLARLARADAHARIGAALAARVAWTFSQKLPDLAYGPASKIFSTETFISDSADLLDLTAPESLVRGRGGLGVIEESYRHSTATSIYAGTSEVLRSLVAERRLGLPRGRN